MLWYLKKGKSICLKLILGFYVERLSSKMNHHSGIKVNCQFKCQLCHLLPEMGEKYLISVCFNFSCMYVCMHECMYICIFLRQGLSMLPRLVSTQALSDFPTSAFKAAGTTNPSHHSQLCFRLSAK